MQRARGDDEDQRAAALTKAGLQAASLLGLSPAETASVLGVQQGALQAMRQGKRAVDGSNGEAECADALIRVVKRLHALLGAGETHWRSWLRHENPDLDGKPIDLLTQRRGVLKVAEHLEQKRSL